MVLFELQFLSISDSICQIREQALGNSPTQRMLLSLAEFGARIARG
jgi:hypothetical protein